jgi:small subunit ribosomal protein S20
MPITKAAKKAVRASRRKRERNLIYIKKYKKAVREAKKAIAEKKPSAQNLVLSAFSALDRAAKVHVIHKNKAANLKSKLHRALNKAEGKAVELKSAKEKKTTSTN